MLALRPTLRPVAALLCMLPLAANAGGGVDPLFGKDGVRQGEHCFGRVNALPLPSDGLLVVSSADARCGAGPSTWVHRLDSDGRPDGTYRYLPSSLPAGYRAAAAALRTSGALLIGGSVDTGGGFIATYMGDGDPDPASGQVSRVENPVDVIALQPDGRIVIASNGGLFSSEDGRVVCGGEGWVLRRLLPGGAPDTSFGNGGRVTSRSVGGSQGLSCRVNALWVEASGLIVVAADQLQRLLPDGTADPTFGTGTAAPIPGNGQLTRMPDGGFVVATATSLGTTLARYDRDGHADPRFGSDGNGRATVSLAGRATGQPGMWEGLWGGFVQAGNGRHIYVAAYLYTTPDDAGARGEAIARFLPDGSLDPSFGNGGVMRLTTSSHLRVRSLVLQSSGKLVVATDGPVLRLLTNGEPSPGIVWARVEKGIVGEGEGAGRVIVSRIAGSSGAISVGYWTDDWAARPGEDFAQVYGRLEWTDGDSSDRLVEIPVIDNGIYKDFRPRVDLYLSEPAGNPVILQGEFPVSFSIADNDPPGTEPTPPPAPAPNPAPAPAPANAGSAEGGGGAAGLPLAGLLGLLWAGARRRRLARGTPQLLDERIG